MKNGFSLVEILLAVALAAVFLPALVQLYSLSIFSTSQGEKFTQAYALAQEQMEAIYYIKDNDTVNWDWSVKPTNTALDEYYQPQLSGGVWSLGTITTFPLQVGEYTKKVEIWEVLRDPINKTIVDASAPVDDDSRFIKVTVSWKERGEEQNVALESLVTK